MNRPYGPWATLIFAGQNPQLCAFWRRRMGMLAAVNRASSMLSQQSVAWLIVAASCVFLIPTLRPAPADAQEKAAREAKAAGLPTPRQILEKLQARWESVRNCVVEASWEEYQDDKPSSWEDGAIFWDKQGHIRVRYTFGPGALAAADRKNAKAEDETYTGKFSVNATADPALDRLGNPRPPGAPANAADGYRSVMIYNGKFDVGAESHRNPFRCMDLPVISDLSSLLAAGKAVRVERVKGQAAVYQLGYEVNEGADNLKHRVLVDAGKGWVVRRDEQFFPNGKSARLSACDYRRGENGWWMPAAGRICILWGQKVPTLDWRFKVARVAVNDAKFDSDIFQPQVEAFPLRKLTETVAGTVVDNNGKPIGGISVRADLHSGASLLMAFDWKPTGKDGRFMIDGLPKAPIPITAYFEHTPLAVRVTVQAGQKDVRIVFDPKPSR